MGRRRGGLAALLVSAGLTVLLATGSAEAATTYTSGSDAFVSADFPTANYATVNYLKVQGGSARNGYVKFTVSGWNGPVGTATLRFWTLTGAVAGFGVHGVSDTTWDERTLTYNNAPAITPAVVGSSGPFVAKTWVSVDVTPLVTGNGTYSFALTTSDTTFLEVATKENGASTAPQLVLSPAVAPANSVAPSISGTPQDGQQLTAAPGSWTGTQPITYTYQWQRCDQTGNSCTNITGATNTTYTATTPDVGNTITVNVTATNTAGNTTQTAAPTTTIQAANSASPANSVAPSISGTPQDGQQLTAAPGSWTGTQPITYTYQWQRCDQTGNSCTNITGATNTTYTATTPDVGNTITVNVTATNTAGNTTQTAAPTTTIQAAAPANTTPPLISGTPQSGKTLTAAPGTWTGTQPITYTYQWQRCNQSGGGCSNLAGATGATYTAVTADVGNTITVNVTATNTAGNTTQTAAPTTTIQPPPSPATTYTSGSDAFVSADFPTANYATVNYLKVQGGSARNGYVKFTVSGWNGPVGTATLRFWTLTGAVAGFGVHGVSDTTWDERTLTYRQRAGDHPSGGWFVWAVRGKDVGVGGCHAACDG